MQRYLLPRLHDFFFLLIFAGAMISGPRMLNTDSDLGRHLTLGDYIIQSDQIPKHDILSFTKTGVSRPPYEWLAQVLFAGAYRILGFDGVVLLTSLTIAAAFTAVYFDTARRSGAPMVSILMAACAAAAASLHWLPRPHVFSFLLFALWLGMLERLRQGKPQVLLLFPVLMLIWVNMHGGFIFGFLAYAAYAAGWLLERWRRSSDRHSGQQLLIVGGASLLASVATPDLWHNWEAVLNNRSAYILSRTVETMPPNIALPNVRPFLALLTLAVLLVIFQRGQVSAAHVLLLGGLGLMSFVMARSIPFFAIAAAPLCGEWLGQALSEQHSWFRFEQRLREIDRGLRGYVWSILAILLAFGFFAYHFHQAQSRVYTIDPQVYPVGAVDWLEQNPQQGNMFNDFNWGGYLLFRMWPAQRVFIDSQSDFYGEAFIRQYESILEGANDWTAQLESFNVAWMLIPRDSQLSEAARKDPAWRLAWQDATAAIFVHR